MHQQPDVWLFWSHGLNAYTTCTMSHISTPSGITKKHRRDLLKAPRPSTYNPNPNMHEPTPNEHKYKLCNKNTLEHTIIATNKSNLKFNTKKHDWKIQVPMWLNSNTTHEAINASYQTPTISQSIQNSFWTHPQTDIHKHGEGFRNINKSTLLWWKIPEGAPEGRQARAPGGVSTDF